MSLRSCGLRSYEATKRSRLLQLAMLGIVRVARHVAAVERRAVVGRERETALQAAWQVRVRDEDAAEGDRVGMAIPDRGVRGLAGKTASGDQHAFPDRAEQHHRRRHVLVVDLGAAGAGRAWLDEVQIGKAERVE